MYGRGCFVLIAGTVVLRNYNRCARSKSQKRADNDVDDLRRRAADRGERDCADKSADNHGIGCVVEHLEKRTEQKRKEKDQELLPDHALCDAIIVFLLHVLPHPAVPRHAFVYFKEI